MTEEEMQELHENLYDVAYDAGWSDYERGRWRPPVTTDLFEPYCAGYWDAVKSYEESAR